MNNLIKLLENIPFIKDNPTIIPWIFIMFFLIIIAFDVRFLIKKQYIKFSILLLIIISSFSYIIIYLKNIIDNKP